MMRLILLLSLLIYTLFAKDMRYPVENCPAYNNLKHTKNTDNILLDTQRAYLIQKKHKGQYLIIIKGENPAQRWVDERCFDGQEEKSVDTFFKSDKQTAVKSKENILALTWHNAYCERYRHRKECQRSLLALGKERYSERHFVLHGLWPQPKSHTYCDVDEELVRLDRLGQWRHLPCLVIDQEIEQRLEKVMPGYAVDLHKHEWIKHGTCYGTDATGYFGDAVSLTEQLNHSKVGNFFRDQRGNRVTIEQVRSVFDRTFGRGAGQRVELRCEQGMITELWLHLGSGSDDLGTLLQRGKKTRSRCLGGIVDRAGFQR